MQLTFRDAVLKGLAEDGGLLMPEKIPVLEKRLLQHFPAMTFQEIAMAMLTPYLEDDFSVSEIRDIVVEAFDFQCSLVQLTERVWSLELFHGPTLAFKDFGVRFMARVLQRFAAGAQKEITVLTATSGDTGSAVARGFYGVAGVRVVILFPLGKVSIMQEKQMTTLGGNICAVGVQGSFDDCQRMVKEAFSDKNITLCLNLTSANSINIARWLPQACYYAYAWSRLYHAGKVVFSVPSGNFGNISAGVLAKKMGVPVGSFIAATNANDVVPVYIRSGVYSPRPSVSTISSAMDVGNPSNFQRLLALYGYSWEKLTSEITGYSFSDEETRKAISKLYLKYGYLADPHGAVGWLGLQNYQHNHPDCAGVFLTTAHAAKFPETVEPLIGKKISIPENLTSLMNKKNHYITCNAKHEELKQILLNG